METNFYLSLITAIFISISASLLGSFVILKKMSLVGDALSHVALPGLALGLLFHFNPFIGGFLTLLAAIIGIWFLKYQTNLPIDTLVGIFFTTSLAIGVLIIPEQELLEAMFGNIASITFNESIVTIALSIISVAILLLIRKKLIVNMLSEELAQSINIKSRQIEFIFLLIFALSVALGIKSIGALLMGSLVIIPAASAKNIAKSFNGFMAWSVIFGIISAILGIYSANALHIAPGPIFIISATIIFTISFLFKKIKS
jgi:zinc transport system permease protein